MKIADAQNRQETWLVLGAGGFIGRTTVAHLKSRNREVVAADQSPGDETGNFFHRLDIFDIQNLRALVRKIQPNILLNAIGHSSAISNSGLQDFYVRSTKIILEAVQAEQPSCRVVLLGSAAEYGNALQSDGSSETDILRPLSDYGRAKCAQFQIAQDFSSKGVDVVTARLFNPIGPGQRKHFFVQALFDRIRRGENPVRVHSGNYLRDWIDIRDVTDALVTLAEFSEPPAVASICTGKSETVQFVAKAIGDLTGTKIDVEPAEKSPDVLWNSAGNPERIFTLGWRPKRNLVQSLADQWQCL